MGLEKEKHEDKWWAKKKKKKLVGEREENLEKG